MADVHLHHHRIKEVVYNANFGLQKFNDIRNLVIFVSIWDHIILRAMQRFSYKMCCGRPVETKILCP